MLEKLAPSESSELYFTTTDAWPLQLFVIVIVDEEASLQFKNRIDKINNKFKGLLSDESTVFNCRPVADNKQYVASLHAGHKKGVISVRDRTQFPTSKI